MPAAGQIAWATVSRIDAAGQLVWTRSLNIASQWNDAVLTPSGNLLVVGHTLPLGPNSQSLMGVIAPAGSFIWVRSFNAPGRESFNRVALNPAPDNAAFPYYVLGFQQEPNTVATWDDVVLLTVSEAGNFGWKKIYSGIFGSTDDEFVRDLEALPNGDLILAGNLGTNGVVFRADNTGAIYNAAGPEGLSFSFADVAHTSGGFLAVGNTFPSVSAFLMKFDSDLLVQWQINLPDLTAVSQVWRDGNDGIYVTGRATVDGLNRGVVLKFQDFGNDPSPLIWMKYLDNEEVAYTGGSSGYLPPSQMAFVDGRNTTEERAFMSVSDLEMNTCMTQEAFVSTVSANLLFNSPAPPGIEFADVPMGANVTLSSAVNWGDADACPAIGSIFGTAYRECGDLPYTDQPVLPGWTVQLLDTTGNLLAEQQTDSVGGYGFYNLPQGLYICRIVLQPGWTPSVPLSGQYLVDGRNTSELRNFGVCPGCSCDDIYFEVVQIPGASDTCEFGLAVNNTGAYCFSAMNLALSAGRFDEVIPANGWEVVAIDSQHVQLTAMDPDWTGFVFHRWKSSQVSMSEVTVSTSYNVGQGNVVCSRAFPVMCPAPNAPPNCCPVGTHVSGAELVVDGNFSASSSWMSGVNTEWFDLTQYSLVVVGTSGVLNSSQVTQQAPGWICVAKSGNPNDYFAVFNGGNHVNNQTGQIWVSWKQSVSVSASTTYNFEAWVKNIDINGGANHPSMQLRIVDKTTVPFTVVAASTPLTILPSDGWVYLCLKWQTPAQLNATGTYELQVLDLQLSPYFNNFALDCISFRECSSTFCIEDFETGGTGQWAKLDGSISVITDPITGSKVLKGNDNSGPSWMYNNSSAYSGDWTQKFNNCLCFDIRYDNGNPSNPTTGTNAIYIYQGSDPLNAAATANIARFVVNTPIGNTWTKVCVPVGLSNGTAYPSNQYGQWTSASLPNFDLLIQNVSGIGIPLDFAGGDIPSEMVFVDNFCVEKCDSDCVCPPNAFTNMSYRPNSGPNVPISCGEIAFWQCNFPVFNLSGDFMCQGNGCSPMPDMFWTLSHPNLGQVNSGLTTGPGFQVSIPNASFSAPGLYTLTIAGICGEDTCYCEILIETPGCGCSANFSANFVACDKYNFFGFANGTSPFIFNWNFGDPNSGANNTSTLQNPMHQFSGPGTYTVTLVVIDAAGCMATYSTTITVPVLPTTVTITGNLGICPGQNTTLTASGGQWTTCQWSNSGSGASIQVSVPGTYCVTCTDVNGCTATGCATVTQHPAPTVSISGPSMICIGQNAVLTATGGASYQWSPNGSTANPFVTPSVLTNTTYTVTATNAQGCTATATFTVMVKLCDCDTDPFIQNGQFNVGNPCAQGDEDICNAAQWCSVWPDYASGISTGDFYNTTTCTPTALTSGVLATPTPGSGLNGNFAGFWCKPHNNIVWREGILNNLSAPITPNSGNYMFSMKMACLFPVSGTPRVSVYGVPVGAASTVPTSNALTAFTPTNPNLFNLGGAVLLGTIPVPSSCNNTYQDIGFSFSTTTLGLPINRIFLTRDDPVGNDWGGTTYLAVDSLCLKPVPNLALCECGELNWATIQQEWTPPQPISCNGPFVPVPCRIQGANYFIHGDFTCLPDFCGNNTVTWVLTRPSPLPPVSGSTSISAYPHFDISLPAAYFTVAGNYSLTITRTCGTTPCHCKLNFKIEACPCLCDQTFADQVALGFSMANSFSPPNQCVKNLKPISLCPNDMVTWTVSDVGTFTSTGNAPVTINFLTSGTYDVCMIVKRTAANGAICTREFCRKIIVKCGIDSLGPITDFCLETQVKNSGFNEGNVPGVLNEVGAIAEWELAPNPGDGFVFVVDSTGSLNDGHIVLVGRKDNFAGIMQEVNLVPNNYLILKFEAINYLGNENPAGTRLEIRLQEEAISYPNMKKQVLLYQEIQDSSGWRRLGATLSGNLDTSLHYFVICLQNDDSTHSIVGVDNIEICSSKFTDTEEEMGGLQSRMRIFPNPNTGHFTLELPAPAPSGTTIRITDPTGRLALEATAKVGSEQQQVQAGALPAGLYFVQVLHEGRVVGVSRFVKQ
ncbi:MAG: T9SS type A sorting domain-containing protein [Saprospiraceae bacterium]